jgi:hypothetical protein
LHCCAVTNSEPQFSISNPQKFLPLAKIAFESRTLGNLESRDHTAFDWLAAFSGTFADGAVFPARAVEVIPELVVLVGL